MVWFIVSPPGNRVGRPLTPPASYLVPASGGLAMGQDTEIAYHRPVMADEVAQVFAALKEGVVVDATFGGGGHTERILGVTPASVSILALDRDPDAAAHAVRFGDRVRFRQTNFREMDTVLDDEGIDGIAGAIFDLGVSSHQLDEATRGFSYRRSGPIDMRMGSDAATSAADIVNEWDHSDLAHVLARFGEERFAARIASAIIRARPITNTVDLAEVVASAVPAAARRSGHPARKTFQALRIAVNEELEAIEEGLDLALDRLATGGRCVVISYHSLEDRLVKRRFRSGSQGCTCPPDLPVCGCEAVTELRLLTRSAQTARREEIEANPRARSARLRAAEKVAA